MGKILRDVNSVINYAFGVVLIIWALTMWDILSNFWIWRWILLILGIACITLTVIGDYRLGVLDERKQTMYGDQWKDKVG